MRNRSRSAGCWSVVRCCFVALYSCVNAWNIGGVDSAKVASYSSSALCAAASDNEEELLSSLPPLGVSRSMLAWEQAEARKRLSRRNDSDDNYSKPNARVRLLCLYGVADSSTSMRKWVTSAPDWVEIRIVELPGHGYLTEGLPPCSYRCSEPLTSAELEEQRSEWLQSLADQIEPLLVDNPNPVPYAFYGFSFGAMMAYLLCLELEKRGIPPPLALFACGRGAPHVIPHSARLQRDLQLWNDQQILHFIDSKMGISTSTMAPTRRERMSALFRCGMLFSCLHVGDDLDEATRVDSAGLLWDDVEDTPVPIASNLLPLNCCVVSLTGSLDTIWPPVLVEKWCDSTLHHYRHFCLDDIAHPQLMNAPETKDIVFQELARLALGRRLSS